MRSRREGKGAGRQPAEDGGHRDPRQERVEVETEQIGDDMVADLGKGTWQLGLRRVLGEFRRADRILVAPQRTLN